MSELISYLQLGANGFALVVAGWIYFAYIKNQSSLIALKDERIEMASAELIKLKEQNSELKKRSPENMEKMLNSRIKIREEELVRLNKDKENHKDELLIKEEELVRLNSELEKAKDIKKTMAFLELDLDGLGDDFFSKDAEYEIEEMGMVAVDSGMLMIADPCYIDSEWQDQPYEDIRLVKDKETEIIYQFKKDFENYQEIIEGFDKTVNELLEVGVFEDVKVDRTKDIAFSYAGTCYATQNEKDYGVLPFSTGLEGAGIAVQTLLGDGMFPVYAEKYDGRIVRVYFNLI